MPNSDSDEDHGKSRTLPCSFDLQPARTSGTHSPREAPRLGSRSFPVRVRMRASQAFGCCVLVTATLPAWAQFAERIVGPTAPRAQVAGGSLAAFYSPADGLRTTVWRGREVTYELVDGWAVHDGDILLGRAEDMVYGVDPANQYAAKVPGPVLRRRVIASEGGDRWPDGVIPYEITEDANDWGARDAPQCDRGVELRNRYHSGSTEWAGALGEIRAPTGGI